MDWFFFGKCGNWFFLQVQNKYKQCVNRWSNILSSIFVKYRYFQTAIFPKQFREICLLSWKQATYSKHTPKELIDSNSNRIYPSSLMSWNYISGVIGLNPLSVKGLLLIWQIVFVLEYNFIKFSIFICLSIYLPIYLYMHRHNVFDFLFFWFCLCFSDNKRP